MEHSVTQSSPDAASPKMAIASSDQANDGLLDNMALETESVQSTDVILSEEDEARAVEVRTEKLEGRQRQITATINIPHSIENVWSILTDYERLAEFIPSLKKSRQIDHPNNGIRLEQIGSESLLKLKFCARVVLDMFESFPHRLGFEMVEGDFKQFGGEWQLQPLPDNRGTELTYTLQVLPSRLMPVGMIERRLGQGLQVNLVSIKRRADELFG